MTDGEWYTRAGVGVTSTIESARVTVRCVQHKRLLEIFDRTPEGWAGLILTNAGDARFGHDAIVTAADEAGVPTEVIQRRHLVRDGEKWINRHRGGIDRTELGFKMGCGACKRPPFHFREPVFGQLLDELAALGTDEIDVHALARRYRGASRVV